MSKIIYSQICIEARKYEGVKETSKNRSPQIDKWLIRVKKRPGRPWCIAYAWCMVDDACTELKIKNPLPPVAGAHYLIQIAKQRKLFSDKPGVGFLFCIDHGVDKQGNKLGHGGIVLEVHKDWLLTIEGNTSGDGYREGNQVAIRKRKLSEITLGYVDVGKGITQADKPVNTPATP